MAQEYLIINQPFYYFPDLAEIITEQPIYPKYICYFNTFSL